MLPTASAEPVDGVLDARPPAVFNGTLASTISDPTVLIQDPGPTQQETPLIVEAVNVTVTHRVYTSQSAQGETPVRDVGVSGLQAENESETYRVENATIEVTALGTDADVLLGPGEDGPLTASLEGAGSAAVVPQPEGIEVLDGYRENRDIEDWNNDFAYEYVVNRSLVALDEAPPVQLTGAAHGYVWDAHVLIRNQTETIATYETGHTRNSFPGDAAAEHRFEYVTFEARQAEAALEPTLGPVQVLQRGASVDVDGTLELHNPKGSLSADSGPYETSGLEAVRMTGNLSVTATPATGTAGTDSRLDVAVDGDLTSTNAPQIVQEDDGVSTTTVAAGAGGVTLLGLAAWYAASVKGASVAVVGAVQRREEEEATAPVVTVPEADQPGDLLFDPDRFSLYHLVRERPGLSPDECQDVTGIEDADDHLATLAEADLLGVLDDRPPRYFVPGTVPEEHVEEIAFLRQPEARRLGELLAVHGLTPETRLAERARRSHGTLSADQVPDLVHQFVDHGLAYRETSEDGFVVDPTDELFECLEALGEGSVPEVS